MITTTGKIIVVEVDRYCLERRCETPGCVTVRYRGQTIELPGNTTDAESFIKAYRRVVKEKIEYKRSEVE